jgi:hypothetical protein
VAWKDELKAKALKRSHLAAHRTSLIGTFLRIDIPILGFLDEYVLYTDVDVFFRSNITLDSFTEKPSFSLGTESKTEGTAGVMLLNVHAMRRTYNDFVSFIFTKEHVDSGFVFSRGPLDQGAYAEFYQRRFMLQASAPFNWKPYFEVNDGASLIHFHGPKPQHYRAVRDGNATAMKAIPKLFDFLLKRCDFSNPQNGCRRHMEEVRTHLPICTLHTNGDSSNGALGPQYDAYAAKKSALLSKF